MIPRPQVAYRFGHKLLSGYTAQYHTCPIIRRQLSPCGLWVPRVLMRGGGSHIDYYPPHSQVAQRPGKGLRGCQEAVI